MPHPILYHSPTPVTLLGGGLVSPAQWQRAEAIAPRILAADGGANHARRLGADASVDAVIGDLDSLTDAETWRNSGLPVHRIREQDSTDFEKCLYSSDVPLFLGLGFLDGRIDHVLATLNAMVRWPEKRVLLLGAEDLCFLAPDPLALDLPPGARVSFFPMAPVTGLASDGLAWPVEGLALAPGGRVGTSNRALGGPMRAAFDRRAVLVMLAPDQLDRAVAALLAR